MNNIENKYKGKFKLNSDINLNGKNEGGISFFNLLLAQNQNALFAYSNLFNSLSLNGEKIGRIIEIGTGNGGLSILFQIFSIIEKCNFITYDIGKFGMRNSYQKLYDMLQIDSRFIDCFDFESKIIKEIQKDNITIILCDGGNKPNEFNYFAPYLKSKDFILVHDYAYNKIDKNEYWCCPDITTDQINESLKKYNIIPYMNEDFYKSATFCGRKL
jgi:hypothetical protein